MKTDKKMLKLKILVVFLLYFLYSLIGIVGKYNAISSKTWSIRFFILLGVELCGLAVFTVGWQVLLKRYDLSFVYLFKGTTVLWGLIFAKLIFNESITIANLLGSFLIMIGIGVVLNE